MCRQSRNGILGFSRRGCIPLGIPGLTKDYAAATEYEMAWPEKLKNDVRAPDAFEIKLPTFSFDTCIEPVFEFPSDAMPSLKVSLPSSKEPSRAICKRNVNPEALKDMAKDAESKLQHIKDLVQDVKGLVNGTIVPITTTHRHSSAPPLPSGANRAMRYQLTSSSRTSTLMRLTH